MRAGSSSRKSSVNRWMPSVSGTLATTPAASTNAFPARAPVGTNPGFSALPGRGAAAASGPACRRRSALACARSSEARAPSRKRSQRQLHDLGHGLAIDLVEAARELDRAQEEVIGHGIREAEGRAARVAQIDPAREGHARGGARRQERCRVEARRDPDADGEGGEGVGFERRPDGLQVVHVAREDELDDGRALRFRRRWRAALRPSTRGGERDRRDEPDAEDRPLRDHPPSSARRRRACSA